MVARIAVPDRQPLELLVVAAQGDKEASLMGALINLINHSYFYDLEVSAKARCAAHLNEIARNA